MIRLRLLSGALITAVLLALLFLCIREAPMTWSAWEVKVIHGEWTAAFPEAPPGAFEPWLSDAGDGVPFRGYGGTWLYANTTYTESSFRYRETTDLAAYVPAFTRVTAGDATKLYIPVLNPVTNTWIIVQQFALSDAAKVLRSTDGGVQFVEVNLSATGKPTAEDAVAVNGRIIAGGLAGIFISTDDGLTWTNTPYGAYDAGYYGGPSSFGVYGDIIVGAHHHGGGGPGFFRSTDGGETWAYIEPAEAPVLRSPSIMVSDTGIMVAISGVTGEVNSVLRSTDLGLTWTLVALPIDALQTVPLGGVWSSDAGKFYIPTRDGSGDILSSEDGVTWVAEATPEVTVAGTPMKDGWTGNLTISGTTMAFATESYFVMRTFATEADPDSLIEALTAGDSVVYQFAAHVRDRVRALLTPQTMQTIGVSVSEVCEVILTARPQFVLSLLEQVTVDSIQQHLQALSVTERVTAADVREALRTRFAEITEAPGVSDRVVPALVLEVAEQIEASLTVTFIEALQLLDRVQAADSNAFLRMASLILGLTARDLTADVYAASIYEALEADLDAQLQLRRVAEALDEVQAALTTSSTLVLAINETLGAQAGDSTETLGHYLANINEETEAWVGFKLGDEQYTGVVMNTEGRRPISTYDGYGFNSFAEIGGHYYGANDEGVYLLEGATDDGEPIPASIKTMLLDFNSTVMKRVQTAYLGYTSDGDLVLRVRAVTGGELREHWFKAQPRTAEAPREQIVTLGRGLRSRYWQFELVNVDGADFEVNQLQLYPVYLSRRS